MSANPNPAVPIRLKLNAAPVEHLATPRTHLADFVRDHCGMTGTHLGCEHGVCGACTVLVDDEPVRSCITYAVACEGRSVRTIEGYDNDPVMRQLRQAFSDEHALQCGYCTPGMLATSYDIVRRLPHADEARVRKELSGNLCRCTGYVGIVRAILSVLSARRQAGDAELSRNPSTSQSSAVAASANAQPWEGFSIVDSGTAAMPAPAATPRGEEKAAPLESRKGWTQMEGSFQVPFPVDTVWAYMQDPRRLAACLPGAEVSEAQGSNVKGRIVIKFGPISAAFAGAADITFDDSQRVGILRGAGVDSISKSRAKGDVLFRLSAIEGQGSRVDVTLAHSLQGPLAQFSRSGLVQDFVSRMIADFGKNLSSRLSGDQSARPAPAGGFSLLLSVLWQRIKRAVSKSP
jgi:carbon-monoxide dehydrogenase small subunit